MNYFEDLNPYFVRQDPDAEVNPDGTLIPPKNPIRQLYHKYIWEISFV